MARMYPSHVREGTKSHAEARVFDLIRTGLGDDWSACHSLGLACHPQKPWAEIDFVLIGPPGVYCLEVKGGRLGRQDGIWQFTNRHDQTTLKSGGPFDQVGSACGALANHLAAKFPWVKQSVVGYGVVTPDIPFDVEGSDIEPLVVYDIRDAGHPFDAYIRRLADYWARRLGLQRHRPVVPLAPQQRQALLDELRGDFDLRPSLRSRIGLACDEILRMTTEQYRVLDGLAENERVIVRGGAGTGKTLLAVEEARRSSGRGKRVFLCCYNRFLAGFLRQALRDQPGVDVHHLHGFMASMVKEANLAGRLPDAEPDDLFTVFYPELCIDAMVELDRLQEYDVLIVDEAQDLLLSAYADVFDAIVKDGITHGKWRFFLDPFQDIFGGLAPAGLQRLTATHPAQYRLTVNCRNTAPVAVATALLSGVDSDSTRVIEGPDVEWYWYRDEGHERREVSKCVNRLLSAGVAPSDVVILSPLRRENGCLRNGLIDVPFSLKELGDPSPLSTDRAIRFSTVGSFKGLEADAVVLVDIGDLEGNQTLLSVYVGASRAKAFLAIFLNEGQRANYDRRAFELGRRLASQGARDGEPARQPGPWNA